MELIFSFKGYTLVNTTIITLIIFLGYVFFYKFLKKYLPELKIDKYFIFSVLSFVLFGSLLRILEQEYTNAWVVSSSDSIFSLGFYFHTPGWLLLVCVVFLFCFFLSYILLKEQYYKLLIPIGFCLSLPFLIYELTRINHFFVLFLAIFLIIVSFLFLIYIFKIKVLENRLIILSQTTDSFATIIGIYFFKETLYEQHPVSRAVVSFCPLLFFILKIVFALIFIYVVDKIIKDREERTYFKLLIIILGFLTGIRDLLTIILLII